MRKPLASLWDEWVGRHITSSMSKNRFEVDVVTHDPGGWSMGHSPLAQQWCRAANGWDGASFANDPRWISVVQEQLAPEGAELVVVRQDDDFVAAIPLIRAKEWDGVLARDVRGMPMGAPLDLTDVAIAPGYRTAIVLDTALRRVQADSEFDLLCFERVRRRSHLLEALPDSGFSSGLSDAGSSAFCDVTSRESLTALSKEQLRNVDRLRRRAEKEHGDVVVRSETGPGVHAEPFEQFLVVESAGWKGLEGTGTALALDLRSQSFLRAVLARFGAEDRARIDFLEIGGQLAAAQLGVRIGATWHLLKIGFDPAFRAIGPGAILLRAFLDDMCDDPGIREVNFTTNPRWADRWHFQTEPCYRVQIFGNTWRGRALAAERLGRTLAKSLRQYLPEERPTPTAP